MLLSAGRRAGGSLLPSIVQVSSLSSASKFSSQADGAFAGAGGSWFSASPGTQHCALPAVQDQHKDKPQQQPTGLPLHLSQQQHLISAKAHQLSSVLALPPALRSPSSTFASAPLFRGLGSGRAAIGGLAGSVLPSRPNPVNLLQTRSYATPGQLLGHAFMLSTDVMFWSGLIGAVIFRRNLIVMLLATEIVMLACNLNFLFAAAYLNDMTGVIMSITITTIAACETAIGLALCVTYFHMRSATDVEALNFLK